MTYQRTPEQKQRDAALRRLRRAHMTDEQQERERKRLHESYLKHKEAKERRRDERRRASLPSYAERQRRYRTQHAEQERARVRTWYQTNRDDVLERRKSTRDRLRAEMIAAYGGRCACCGEHNPRFLTIDHINGGGTNHRRTVGWSGNSITQDLKRQGWPQEGYQLLCFNCNCGRAYNNGTCPHKDHPASPTS